jgi:uncharacterized protein YdiU (UPF0061 family)
LGLSSPRPDDAELFVDLLKAMHELRVDFTMFFRRLADVLRGRREPLRALDTWIDRWLERVTADGDDLEAIATGMDRVNPVYVPRNHLVEEALAAGSEGDLSPLRTLLEVLRDPYTPRAALLVDGVDRFASPTPDGNTGYVTYCGT